MKSFLSFCLVLSSLFLNAQENFYKYNEEAFFYFHQQDYINAIKKFSKALEYKSEVKNGYKVADTYINRGFCRHILQSNDGAQLDFDEALKIKPEYIKVYQCKATVFLNSNQYDKAVMWADKGLEIKPTDDELRITKAKSLSQLKKFEESNKIYFTLLEENPKNKTAYKFIGSNFQMKKSWDSALKYFSEAIVLDPLDYASHYDRGIAKSYLKDIDGAVKDIELAMKIDSTEKWIGYNNIAYFVKLEQKDFKGALEMFNKTIELNPKFAYAYSNRAFAKLNLNDMKGAYQDIKKSIELDNKNSYAFKNYALILLKDGKKSDACYNLKKAVELGYAEMYDDEVDKLLKEHCAN